MNEIRSAYLEAGASAVAAFSGLRYNAVRTGSAQARVAKGNWTRIARTTHLCPQRKAV